MVQWLAARDFTVRDLAPDTTRYIDPEPIITALGLQGYDTSARPKFLMANRQIDGVVDVTGFDWLVPLRQRAPSDTVWPAGDTVAAGLGKDGRSLEVRRGGALVSEIGLGAIIDTIVAWRLRTPQGNAPPDSLLVARAPDGSAVFYIRQVGLRDSVGVWRVEQLDGTVLVRRAGGIR
jgi:hypothetical protein